MMAQDFDHIDQIIRQKFENFEPEPPVEAWEKIKSGLPKTPPPPASPGILLPIIVAVSLLVFVAGLFYHLNYYDPQNGLNPETGAVTIHAVSFGSTGSSSVTDNALQEDFYKTPSVVAQPEIGSGAPETTALTPVNVRMPFDQNLNKDKKKKNIKSSDQKSAAGAQRTGEYKPGLVKALKAGELTSADAVNYNLSPRDVRKLSGYREYSNAKFAEWSLGLYFNPEVTSGVDESIENTISYNLSILPRISFNHFYIQSGINARFTSDKGNMAVDYNRYLGSYEDVYQVTFDTVDNVIVPTFYTETVDVYDTISHYYVSETKANYTYLEVPVLFGYRYSFGRFSLFANAGPSASFLVNTNLPDPGYPEENSRIVNVDYQVPLRSTIYWQMFMGAGFDYQIADRIRFSLEPTFRFGMKPEYDLPSGMNGETRSFGVRAGINYKF